MDGILGFDGARLAATALRANGGFAIALRLPGPAASGQDSEQLGLATPVFEDQPLFPAIWRKVGVDAALLVAAGPVTALVGTGGFGSAQAMFEAAAGVVVEGVFYTISAAEPVVSGGVDVGYRVSVSAPVWA